MDGGTNLVINENNHIETEKKKFNQRCYYLLEHNADLNITKE